MYLLGLDIGSSSIKASIVRAKDGHTMSLVQYPETEMQIISDAHGWAEQQPEVWWENTKKAIKLAIEKAEIRSLDILSIGISYQMHGLVLIDKNQEVLRPSIIWCDSRAVEIGNTAFQEIGQDYCLEHYLNSPANFTASKLKWVKDNEAEVYEKIHKVLLPGDYINMRLTGEINTTISGLSEGVFWDFKEHKMASKLLNHFGFPADIFPDYLSSISDQGTIKASVANNLGFRPKVKVTYRAGDQPSNAMSLGVLQANQVAATGGTSGVIYGIVDDYIYDHQSRINGFAHINHRADQKRIGLLLCINGAGIQYAWMKKQIARDNLNYADMEKKLQSIPVGSDGLCIHPFGNGAERMLNNINEGARISNLHFNRHTRVHFYRAALEGIAFSFVYGFQLLKKLGLDPSIIKVGNDNLFRSATFSHTIANLLNTSIDLLDTSGAVGAAKASGIVVGTYASMEEAMSSIQVEKSIHPKQSIDQYTDAYQAWKQELEQFKQ